MTSRPILKGPRRRRVVNVAMDAYLDWRDQCAAVSDAYRCWADAGEADAAPAWRAYEAALDREERASALYADLVRDVDDLAVGNGERGAELAASGGPLR